MVPRVIYLCRRSVQLPDVRFGSVVPVRSERQQSLAEHLGQAVDSPARPPLRRRTARSEAQLTFAHGSVQSQVSAPADIHLRFLTGRNQSEPAVWRLTVQAPAEGAVWRRTPLCRRSWPLSGGDLIHHLAAEGLLLVGRLLSVLFVAGAATFLLPLRNTFACSTRCPSSSRFVCSSLPPITTAISTI